MMICLFKPRAYTLSSVDVDCRQAFDNVRETIERAGGKMSQVYKLTVYFAPYDDKISAPFLEQRKHWFPNHKPTVTAVAVPRLAFEKMTVEIEAWAHLP